MSSHGQNTGFLKKIDPNWCKPLNDGRRKDWSPSKHKSRSRRREIGKVQRRKAIRLVAQHVVDFFKSAFNRPSMTRTVFPVKKVEKAS